MQAVREYKPDILFIVARLMDINVIDNGTNPFNDIIWKVGCLFYNSCKTVLESGRENDRAPDNGQKENLYSGQL